MRARAEHLFARTITRPAVPFRLPMPARRNRHACTGTPAVPHTTGVSGDIAVPPTRRGRRRRAVPSPGLPYRSDRLHRRVGTLTRPYRHASRTAHDGRERRHSRTPYAPGASRFPANARQSTGQRRAIGAGGPERRNRPTSEGHRIGIVGVVHDAPHHTPAAPCLDEPQATVGPRDNGHTPVTQITHLSPTNARICAAKLCSADT